MSVSKSETIIWDAKTLESIVVIDEVFSLACYRHRLLVAILHDSLYKKFSQKLLREFSDDIPEEKESTEQTSKAPERSEITVSGSMNCIYPKILSEMMKRGK